MNNGFDNGTSPQGRLGLLGGVSGSVLYRRLGAFLTDALLASAFVQLVAEVYSRAMPESFEFWQGVAGWLGTTLCFALLLVRDLWNGRSPGKRLMRLSVVTLEGERPSAAKLLARNVTLLVAPVELLAVLTSENKQRLSDRLLGLQLAERVRTNEK